MLTGHRDDRCFRAKRVWIQGLPLDPGQAQQILQYAKDQHQLPISNHAIENIGQIPNPNLKSSTELSITPPRFLKHC